MSLLCKCGQQLFLYGEGDTFAAVEDAADDHEDDDEESQATGGQRQVGVAMDGVHRGVEDGGTEPDNCNGADEVLDEFSAEGGEGKEGKLHFKDAGGELEELERGGRRAHGGDEDGEEFLALEAVAHALVALTVDALEKKELAAGAADHEGNDGADGRGSGGHEAEEEEFTRFGMDVADDDAIHGTGDGDEGGVQKSEAADAPDAEGLEDGEEDSRELVEQSDGVNGHGVSILAFGEQRCEVACEQRCDAWSCDGVRYVEWERVGAGGLAFSCSTTGSRVNGLGLRGLGRRVGGLAGEEIEGVGQEMKDGLEGGDGAARAAGEVEEESGAGGVEEAGVEDGADASAEGGEWGVTEAVGADELRETGDETGGYGEGGFGCDVTGGETGAAGGDDERGAGGGGTEAVGEGEDVVGQDEVVEDLESG